MWMRDIGCRTHKNWYWRLHQILIEINAEYVLDTVFIMNSTIKTIISNIDKKTMAAARNKMERSHQCQ